MDRFLETCKSPIQIQEEIENIKGLATNNEIESGSKTLSTNKSPGQASFTSKFYQIYKELTSIPKDTHKKRTLLNIFWGQHYPDTTIRQRYHKKIKLHTNTPYKCRCKNLK